MEIDKQLIGGYHDSLEIKHFDTEQACDAFYNKLITVFFNINLWTILFDDKVKFYRTDIVTDKNLESSSNGDLIKIKIPGPKSKMGNGFDWVEIKDKETNRCVEFVSHAVVLSPYYSNDTGVTKHFLTSKSKNYFIVKKYFDFITVEAHGRNEIPNCKNVPMYSKWRNYFIAKGGIFGGSKVNWEIWCKNILDEKYLNKCTNNNSQDLFTNQDSSSANS